jgi:hypothetical protein
LKSKPSKEIIWLQGRENQKERPKKTNRSKGSSVSKWPLLNPPNFNNRKDYGGLDGKVKGK